jgi:hypothetical protein
MRDGNGSLGALLQEIGIQLETDQEHVEDHADLSDYREIRRGINGKDLRSDPWGQPAKE